MTRYLFSNNRVGLSQPFLWPEQDYNWKRFVGKIKPLKSLTGISDEFEVVTTQRQMGDVGGLFWIVNYMMKRFPCYEGIIIIEADCVLRKEWYPIIEKIYLENRNKQGPLGDALGLISCYDSKIKLEVEEGSYRSLNLNWKCPSPKQNGKWDFSSSVNAVMLFVSRELYLKAKIDFEKDWPFKTKSGDHAIARRSAENKLNIVSTHPSYCQHIGFNSLLWPGKGLRAATNFRNFCFEKFDSDGYAYSEKWELM